MRAELPSATKSEVRIMWQEAEYVNENSRGGGEERYNQEQDVFMVSQNGVVKTILNGEYTGRVKKRDVCEWCGKDKMRLDECLKCDSRLC